MREFAAERGLEVSEDRSVNAYTPALLNGSGGGTPLVAEGELAPGLSGLVCHHTFEKGRTSRDSTVVLASVPESIAFAPALVCRDRAEMGAADLAQLPAETWEETRLESTAFGERYRLYALVGQDAGWMRELFSPQLIAWLGERAPEGLSFELNEGHLTVALPGHLTGAAELDELCAAAAELEARIRKEADEEDADPDLFHERQELADIGKAIPSVTWPEPPASVSGAVDAYRKVAGRKASVIVGALAWSLVIGAAVGAGFFLIGGLLAAVPAGLLAFVLVFPLARLIRSIRYRFGSVSVTRVALEAWAREYAASRGLTLGDRWAFHAEMRGLKMPGVADHVLAGELPGTGLQGRFVMLGDAPELRSQGREIAITADRPLAASAVLVEAGGDLPADAAEKLGPGLPEEYRVEQDGRHLMVWRPIAGNLIRTSEGSDRFIAKAGEAIRELVGPDVADADPV